jgi:hypothetical protein
MSYLKASESRGRWEPGAGRNDRTSLRSFIPEEQRSAIRE